MEDYGVEKLYILFFHITLHEFVRFIHGLKIFASSIVNFSNHIPELTVSGFYLDKYLKKTEKGINVIAVSW